MFQILNGAGNSRAVQFKLSEMAVESYGDAVLSAARETGLDEKSFTSEMPWALADTLRDDFILD
ncbi:hypothetical protein CBH30_04760 [Salmonella enterica subsp. enterica serovar Montevideo]|nr:hypothetical protein [Salmonella enterica subsp. enterica serovar Montevideo]